MGFGVAWKIGRRVQAARRVHDRTTRPHFPPYPLGLGLARGKLKQNKMIMEWFVVCHGVVWDPNKPEDKEEEKEELKI